MGSVVLIWGKVVGVLLGLASARWYLVLLGLVVGHQFDRGLASRFQGGQIRVDRHFVKVLFLALGSLAKANGRVSEADIRAARKLMHRLSLNVADTQLAMAQYREGKSAGPVIVEELAAYFEKRRPATGTKAVLMQLLLSASIEAGSLSQPARSLLWSISKALDFSRVELAQLEAVIRAQQSFSASAQGQEQQSRLAQAYAELNVAPEATDKDLKRAYQRLLSKNHPDKLVSSSKSQQEIEAAGQKTQRIIKAYELIRQRRKLG
ncbi:MAG: co-chaperone DjlA [Pseudomonadota bacterium]